MSKNTSRGSAQVVARSMCSTPRVAPEPRNRQPKAGPATTSSQDTLSHPEYKGSRSGTVLVLHRKDMGTGAADTATGSHHEPGRHPASRNAKTQASAAMGGAYTNAGTRRFGRGARHTKKRAS